GFRVGKRARTKILEDTHRTLVATQDGYLNKFGILHQREFKISEGLIIIDDLNNKEIGAEAFLHFAPGFSPYLCHDYICFEDSNLKIHMDGFLNVEFEDYQMAEGFNVYRKGVRAVVKFKNQLK